jgi:hypothetical protein
MEEKGEGMYPETEEVKTMQPGNFVWDKEIVRKGIWAVHPKSGGRWMRG